MNFFSEETALGRWEPHELCPCPACRPKPRNYAAEWMEYQANQTVSALPVATCDTCGCPLDDDGRCPDLDGVRREKGLPT